MPNRRVRQDVTDRRQRVRRSYDELGDRYADSRSDEPPELTHLDRFLETLPDDATVLDAGCGPGTPVASTLADRVAVLGLDVSRGQLTVAHEAVPDGAFVQGDMTRLPMADESVAGVVAFHSIIHVPTDDHPDVFAEFARVLEAGGPLLVTSGTAAWEGSNPDWLGDGTPMHWSYPGPDETRAMLETAGFTVEDTWTVADGFADAGEKWVALATLSA